MRRVVRAARSRRDLEAIGGWIADRDPLVAAWVVDGILRAGVRLAELPNRGRPGKRSGMRELVVGGTYLLLVDAARGNWVAVLHVRHGARLWAGEFWATRRAGCRPARTATRRPSPMPDLSTRRIVLARRPQGAPAPEDFRLEDATLPELGTGEVLVRTLWLSLDPYMRGRMNEGPSYAPPVPLGGVMEAEAVGVVEASGDPLFEPGDRVLGRGGWQSRFALPAGKLRKIDPADAPVQTALGVLGMPGLTAYAALKAIARPKAGETVVVGAATGAVGAVAGQLAKLEGCRVVGVAGGADKCAHAVRELGFDACLDRREGGPLEGRLRQLCPDGVDVYVELVGGDVFWATFPLLNQGARVPVIGTIAWYNLKEPPPGPDRTPQILRAILTKRLLVQGMIVWDYAHLEADFRREVGSLIRNGRLTSKEDVVDGLENAPEAFMGLLEGRNFGKLLVRVGD